MIAPRQLRIIMSSGMGVGTSATIGAKMVTDLAVTLQIPKTVPMNWFGKYYSVHM